MSADYTFNDKGIKFTYTGKNDGWGGTSNGNGYTFIVHNGKMYGTTEPTGHSGLVLKKIFHNTKFSDYNKKQMKSEFSINNRNVSICGRLYPHINSDNSSVLTFWNYKVHDLQFNKKRLAALIKLVGDYFNIDPKTINYNIGTSSKQYKCNYLATEKDVKELLDYTIQTAQNSEQRSFNDEEKQNNDNLSDVDSSIFSIYAKKPYSELTSKEKDMFHQLRDRNDIKNTLQKQNPNFTDAQWNNMRTIGDSIQYEHNIFRITEEQYHYILNCKNLFNINKKN